MALVIELFLIGIGLSMDAFAVSICKGLVMEKVNKKQAFIIGLYFGGFQALMPLIGWFLGIRFQKYITSIDHWIAFVLLALIGGKMIVEAIRDPDVEEIGKKDPPLDHKEMFLLAVATSIDALAVGITFAFSRRFMKLSGTWDSRPATFWSRQWVSAISSVPVTRRKRRLSEESFS